jgi:RNA polymerase sigma-70 factor, ECF subfamily
VIGGEHAAAARAATCAPLTAGAHGAPFAGAPTAPYSVTYEQLYSTHHSRVLRLCRLLLADPEEAHDVSQEVFLKMHRQHSTSGDAIAWGPWLNRVAVNACRDRRRSSWWKSWRAEPREFKEAHLVNDGPTPEQAVLGDERRRQVWSAFQRLPARQREVFALRVLEDCSTADAADALGVTAGSVKRHLFRAVRHMRVALGGRP